VSLVIFGATVRKSRAAPGAFVPPITGFHDVAFAWDTVATADSYTLQVGTSWGASNTYNATRGNTLFHTLSLQSGTYYWRAKAYNGVTLLSTTDELEVTV
jgi:hypothetical protein